MHFPMELEKGHDGPFSSSAVFLFFQEKFLGPVTQYKGCRGSKESSKKGAAAIWRGKGWVFHPPTHPKDGNTIERNGPTLPLLNVRCIYHKTPDVCELSFWTKSCIFFVSFFKERIKKRRLSKLDRQETKYSSSKQHLGTAATACACCKRQKMWGRRRTYLEKFRSVPLIRSGLIVRTRGLLSCNREPRPKTFRKDPSFPRCFLLREKALR